MIHLHCSSSALDNICLTNPEDMYRTCFQRSEDPSNELTADTILRNDYNIGAHMHERGKKITGPSYIKPYTPPYVGPDEELTYGSVYLSMVKDDNTTLACDDKLDLEEITLEWLKVRSSLSGCLRSMLVHK